jgi:hypothetical protein
MTRLLHAELLKLRSTRTFATLAGCAVAVALLVVILATTVAPIEEVGLRGLLLSNPGGIFIWLLGAIGITGEWRHRTIASSVLAAPDRARLLTAKTLAYALAGVVVALVVTASMMLAGTLIVSSRGGATLGLVGLADVLWRNLVVAGLLAALGVGVGALLRHQVVTVTALLLLGFVIEPLLLPLIPEVMRFGPTVGAPGAILGSQFPGIALLEPGFAVAVSVVWATATLASAAAVLRRRDLV